MLGDYILHLKTASENTRLDFEEGSDKYLMEPQPVRTWLKYEADVA